MGNTHLSKEDKVLQLWLTRKQELNEIYYRVPCIPSKLEVEKNPELRNLLANNVCIDFLGKEMNNLEFVAYIKYDYRNKNFDLIHEYLSNRDIEVQLIRKSQVEIELDELRGQFIDWYDWIYDEENIRFVDKYIYDFGIAVEGSEQTLKDEIEQFSNGNEQLNNSLTSMCKYLICEGFIIQHGSNSVELNEKFDSSIHEHDFDYSHLLPQLNRYRI